MPNRSKQAAAGPVVLASMTPNAAVAGFKVKARDWHSASVAMVASGAICIIVGAYSPNGNRVEYDAMILRLKQEVAETGIKQPQIYKYVGLARGLVDHLFREFKVEGDIIQAVLKSKTHDEAMDAVMAYLGKLKVKSLDDVGVLAGKYRRSEGPPTQAGGDQGDGEDADGSANPTRASAEAISARITSDPEVLTDVKADDLVGSYLKAGHKPSELIEALIPHIDTVRECSKLITKLTNKLTVLRRGLKVVTSDGKRRAG